MTVAQQIRADLKAAGINSKQVSVTSDGLGANVRIKDFRVDAKKVKELAEKYRDVDYCQFSGEVLEGGNTFVSVSNDLTSEFKAYETPEYREIAAKVGEAIKNGVTWNRGVELFPDVWLTESNGIGAYRLSVPWESQNRAFCDERQIAFFLYVGLLQGKLGLTRE